MTTSKLTLLIISLTVLAVTIYFHQQHSQQQNCLFCRHWGTMISLGSITISLLLN